MLTVYGGGERKGETDKEREEERRMSNKKEGRGSNRMKGKSGVGRENGEWDG